MNNRKHAVAALALATLLLSGCAAASGAVGPGGPTEAGQGGAATASGASSAHSGHDGGHGQSATTPGAAKADGPSAAALMVCGDETRGNVTTILGLNTPPHTVQNWADSTFTCTYHLNDGALNIAVQEAADQASALKYFSAMQALAKDAKPIEGLANLGFPAYETQDGSAVFQKDNKILHVDASKLQEKLGPEGISRTAFAYQLATTILACWKEHP